MSNPSSACTAALMLSAAVLLGACSRSAEKDPGNQTTSASTGTAGARGTATGETNPTTPSGVSGTADRTGATAPTGTTGIIGSSGGVPQAANEGPKITAAGSPGSPQSGGEGAGASGSSNSSTGAPGTAGTFGRPGEAGNAAAQSGTGGTGGTTPGSAPGGTTANAAAGGTPFGATAGGGSSARPASSAPSGGAGPISGADKSFITTAAASGLFEVQSAQLAVSRAASSEVKAYATMLVNQHVNANNELAQLAAVHAVALPTDLPQDLQGQVRRLSQGASKEFDREFVQAVIKAHERDIALFEKAGDKVHDPQLKAWIDKTLPSLRQHLEAAQRLAKGA